VLAFRCIDALLGDALQEAPPPRAAASAYAGLVGQRYHAAGSGKVVAFAQAGDRLALSWLGGAPVPLRERAGGLFLDFLDVAQNGIDIDLEGVDTTQPPPTLALREAGELQPLQRLPETPPDAAALAPQLCGRYRSDELDADAQIELGAQGQLLMTLQGRHGRLSTLLKPFSDRVLGITPTDLLIAALGASNIINIERGAGGEVTGLRYDSARTRGLRFVREEPKT
jgi:hypothetical protein